MTSATMNENLNSGAVDNVLRNSVFLKVSFGTYGNTRRVSNQTLGIVADEETVRVNKSLLQSKELDELDKSDAAFRRWIYDISLPYDMGIYVLSLRAVETFNRKFREYRDGKRAELIERFMGKYSRCVSEAEQRLSSVQVGDRTVNLFKSSDYLSEAKVRDRFYADYEYLSFSTPDTLSEISESIFEEEREKASSKLQSATDEMIGVMRGTLLELVTHLKTKLTPGDDGKAKILRDTAVTNLSDFLKTFDLRNVTNDTELASLVGQCRSILRTFDFDADVLRNITTVRERVQRDMTAVSDELAKLVIEKPSRKFRFDV